MRDPDSTQTNMNSEGQKKGEKLRFVKPCPGEISDVMPVEAEIDSSVAELETPVFFIRTFNAEGTLKSEVPLKKYSPVYVGRALGCHIDLVEPSISRRHCAFQYKELIIDALGNTESGFMIYDLKSSHGTFLNEKRIPSMENIKLKHNDKITFGLSTTEFRFWDSKHEESEIVVEAPVVEVTQEVDEALLRQQPSSTSQPEETRTEAESWFLRYVKVFYQITEMTKEFEEQGVLLPETSKMVARRFKQQNTKFVQQAHVTSLALAELLGNESTETVPVKRRQRKRKSEIEKSFVEQKEPVRKRGRQKKEKVMQDVAPQTTPKKNRRGRNSKKQDQLKLAEEVQKQIQQTQSTLLSSQSSDYLLNTIPSFNGMFGMDDNDPLSIINGPLLQSNDEDVDATFISDAPPLGLEPDPMSIVTENRAIIEPPALIDPVFDNFMGKESSVGLPDFQMPPKKRRGRAPRLSKEVILAPIIAETAPPQPLLDPFVVSPVKPKRGRKPRIVEYPIEVNATHDTDPLPNVEEVVVVQQRRRGRKSANSPKASPSKPLQPIENNGIGKRGSRKRKEQTLDDTIDHVPKSVETSDFNMLSSSSSPQKEILLSSSNINGNFSLLTMKKPFVLLRKLEFVQSSEGKTTPIGIEGNISCR